MQHILFIAHSSHAGCFIEQNTKDAPCTVPEEVPHLFLICFASQSMEAENWQIHAWFAYTFAVA